MSIVPAETPPLPLVVTIAAAALPDGAWTFLVARALEDARGGLYALRGLDADARTEALAGAQAALLGATPDGERAREARPPRGRLFDGADGDARAALVSDLGQLLSKPLDWDAFERAAAHTANRVGLLACGSPVEALAALAREDAALAKAAAPTSRPVAPSCARCPCASSCATCSRPAYALGSTGES